MAVKLRALTRAVSDTGSVECGSGTFGGVVVSTDGVNQAVILVRETDASGRIVFEIETVNSGSIHAPYYVDKHDATLYYDISGTNAKAQLFEWRE